MDKVKLIEVVSKGSHARNTVDPELIIGDISNGYDQGDILDANATGKFVNEKIHEIVGNAIEALDTLEEIGGAIPTKISDLRNDTGFVTEQEVQNMLPTVPTNVSAFTNDAGYLTEHQDISGKANISDITTLQNEKASKAEVEALIANLEEGGYGIRVVNGGTPERIGNLNMHRTLPIQNKMKRCAIKNGQVIGYISETDYTRYTTGVPVDYTGGDGDIMVEIPEYYYEAYRYVDGNDNVDVLILHPYAKIGRKSKKVYIGAFEATSDGTTLSSICTTNFTISDNTVDMSSLTYSDNASTYRGGDKSDTNDDNIKSLLGRPISSLTRPGFRTRAAAKGTGYSQQYWSAYQAMVRLYVVEYANFNSQAAYNAATTADGYKQGGLGDGCTTTDSTKWNNFNSYNPLAPCGITKSLVNDTGFVNILYPANTFTTAATTFSIPSYRGIENPFGHINKWVDGININTANNTTTVYTTEDITNFADDTNTNYTLRASFTKPSDNYIKTWNWDQYGDFIPTSTGGTSSSYLYDYSYWNTGWRVLHCGGYASGGAAAGLFRFGASVSAGSGAGVGGRLYYTPSEN